VRYLNFPAGDRMIQINEEYLVDEHGNRKAVVEPLAAWQQILEALDELEDIRAYDAVKRWPSDSIPFEEAVSEIRQGKSD
jgi:hypothetical protein